jgi:hypothetical protein
MYDNRCPWQDVNYPHSYNPTGDHVYAYKMGVDGTGRPLFTSAGSSSTTYAGQGVPTITSLNGQPGTGIVSNVIQFAIRTMYNLHHYRCGYPILIKAL